MLSLSPATTPPVTAQVPRPPPAIWSSLVFVLCARVLHHHVQQHGVDTRVCPHPHYPHRLLFRPRHLNIIYFYTPLAHSPPEFVGGFLLALQNAWCWRVCVLWCRIRVQVPEAVERCFETSRAKSSALQLGAICVHHFLPSSSCSTLHRIAVSFVYSLVCC